MTTMNYKNLNYEIETKNKYYTAFSSRFYEL